jgi:hypothetical protein
MIIELFSPSSMCTRLPIGQPLDGNNSGDGTMYKLPSVIIQRPQNRWSGNRKQQMICTRTRTYLLEMVYHPSSGLRYPYPIVGLGEIFCLHALFISPRRDLSFQAFQALSIIGAYMFQVDIILYYACTKTIRVRKRQDVSSNGEKKVDYPRNEGASSIYNP